MHHGLTHLSSVQTISRLWGQQAQLGTLAFWKILTPYWALCLSDLATGVSLYHMINSTARIMRFLRPASVSSHEIGPSHSLAQNFSLGPSFSMKSESVGRSVTMGDRDLGFAFQTHPGRQAFISSGSKEPRSALESRRVSLGANWVDSRESSLLRRLERGREIGL